MMIEERGVIRSKEDKKNTRKSKDRISLTRRDKKETITINASAYYVVAVSVLLVGLVEGRILKQHKAIERRDIRIAHTARCSKQSLTYYQHEPHHNTNRTASHTRGKINCWLRSISFLFKDDEDLYLIESSFNKCINA